METSFRDKFQRCLNKVINISKPDYSISELNYYADFLEILTLYNKEGISYGDIQDRFFGEIDETTSIENIENDIYLRDNESSQISDSKESFIENIFGLLSERITQYGEFYPFKKTDEQIFILKDNLSDIQKIYIFLLLSSSLDIFVPFNAELTSDFETICYETLKAYLPTAEVKAFGKNTQYVGNARDKIKQLAMDIGLSINETKLQQINVQNVQERGLDVVGWLPFKDKCPNLLILLGQCACGKQYEYKQHDLRRFKNYYFFEQTQPQQTLFVPFSLVNPKENNFYHSDYIEEGYIIFERMRILNLLQNNDWIFNSLNSKRLVDECVKYIHSI